MVVVLLFMVCRRRDAVGVNQCNDGVSPSEYAVDGVTPSLLEEREETRIILSFEGDLQTDGHQFTA